MHNFKSVVFASLVASSLIAPIGSVWSDERDRRYSDRDRFEDLKDRFERERDRWERDGRGGRRGRDDRDIRLLGTVEYVDKKRQALSVRERADRVVTVVVPSDIAREDKERFAQLRKGENVRLAVAWTRTANNIDWKSSDKHL
jgi:hypothetical protein